MKSKYIVYLTRQIIEILEKKRSLFHEKMEKKVLKILQNFKNNLKEFNKKNMVCLLIYCSLLIEVMKSYFRVEFTGYLEIEARSLFMDYIKYQNMQNIKKVGILLGGDNWKRIALQDDHEYIIYIF